MAAPDPIRYATENPYTKGSTLVAGQEVQTPEGLGTILWMVETALAFSGGGRVSRYQPVAIADQAIPGISLATSVANTNWVPVRVAFPVLVLALSVTGVDGAGNSAVAIGDTVYYDLGVLNVDNANGSQFGVALAAVNSAATAVIPVLLLPFPGTANAA